MYAINDQIKQILRQLGSFKYETMLPEVTLLASLLQEDEVITGVVFGRYKHFLEGLSGHGALVSTNYRILLIDRKPTFTRYEELPYTMISDFNFTTNGPSAFIALETRVGNISMRSWNHKAMEHFSRAIEGHVILK